MDIIQLCINFHNIINQNDNVINANIKFLENFMLLTERIQQTSGISQLTKHNSFYNHIF
jgi:hypothetical protein